MAMKKNKQFKGFKNFKKKTVKEQEANQNTMGSENQEQLEQKKVETSESVDNEQVSQQEETNEPQAEIETNEARLERELAEMKDKYLRLSAEFDNYRKRTLKERMDMLKTASEEVLLGLLQVIDNFERALKNMETSQDVEAIREGVELIYKNFVNFLAQKGMKEIDALNAPFDTDLHEAITKIPAPTADLKGKVVDVIEKGYKLHDKVSRYAKVVIGE
jgi:molecular chaperone GrpE